MSKQNIDGKAYTWQRCPLSKMRSGQCRCAWHYAGKIHCLYHCGDVVVTGKNMRCPYTEAVKAVQLKKMELERMCAAKDDELSLTEGDSTNSFA